MIDPQLCDVCDKAYASPSSLMAHKKTHDLGPLLCEVCNKYYASTSSLITHKKTHDLDHKAPCDICHKLFRKNYLQKHMKACTPEKPDIKEVFSCNFCDKKFDKINSLNRHLQSHDSIVKFSCDICSKDFTLKDSLTRHRKSAHEVKIGEEIFFVLNKKEKPYCKICDMKFKNNANLKRHMNLFHMESRNSRLVFGPNIFIIEECHNNSNKEIGDMMKDCIEDLLGVVVQTVMKKKLTCSLCGKQNDTKKALSDHKLRVHQQKEQCKHCHKKFNPGYNMNRHVKLVHDSPVQITPERNPKRKREMSTPSQEYSLSWQYKKAKILSDILSQIMVKTPH